MKCDFCGKDMKVIGKKQLGQKIYIEYQCTCGNKLSKLK